ncbi:MAG TPA: DUF2147 domain-containing protein [Polyangiales bacterium]|nr:DUF2147 domain-containing protein [Polyangiales bacterium]
MLASVFTLAPKHGSAADQKTVFGYWKHVDEETGKPLSIFKLWEYEGKLVGKIVKTFPKGNEAPQTVCSECSGKQHNKPVVGLLFLWGFERDDDTGDKWVDGTVLNPANGKTYNCEVELSDDGKTLKVFGYVKMLFKVGGTSVWQRPTPSELASL